MADTFYSAAKQQFMEGVKDKFFGQGLLGRSLKAGYEAKFGQQQPDVEAIENQNVSILRRIEVVVTNISDNIYNIAGVLNAQLTSMKQTEDEMRRQELERLVSMEEQTMEMSTPIVPKVEKIKPKTEKKDTMFDMLNSTFSLFRNSISKFARGISSLLKSKKFLALAGVAAVGGAATYAAMKDKDPNLEQDQQTEPQGSASLTVNIPEPSKQQTSNVQNISSPTISQNTNVQNVSSPTISQNNTNIQTTLTRSLPDVNNVFNLAKQKEQEKSAIVQKLLLEKKYQGGVPEDAPELKELDSKYQSPMIEAMFGQTKVPAVTITPSNQSGSSNVSPDMSQQADKMIALFNSYKQTNQFKAASPSTTSFGSLSVSSSEPSSMFNSETSTPVTASPSTGSNINQASTNVETMSEGSFTPTISNFDNSSTSTVDTTDKPRNKIPPPVANRGSLDTYSFFNG
jgi:uncharacterized protein (UPF0333 family)